MAKKTLLLNPGKFYHVYNHACGFESLFVESSNYDFFLENFYVRLGSYLDIYCYCLIPNHFHFLVKMKDIEGIENISYLYSKKFSDFFNSYTQSFNRYFKRKGSLFNQNFKRKEIDDMFYLKTLVIYIHRNPIKHGLVNDFSYWGYSSYKEILEIDSRICRSNEVISWFGDLEKFEEYHTINVGYNFE